MNLLKSLTQISGASSDESLVKKFILDYVNYNKNNWKSKVEIHNLDSFQDNLILTFGKPKIAVYSHIDSVGFTVGYNNDLINIGSPKIFEDTILIGKDSKGEIECGVMLFESEYKTTIQAVYDRIIDRGTILTFKAKFIENKSYIISPFIDNRLGVWNALKLCESIENCAIVFSTYEEHGGNSVAYLASYLNKMYGIRRALISDITWVTNNIKHGGGVVISMRDSGLPRKVFLDKIINLAKKSNIPFQLEVESSGGSDGTMLQKSGLLIDWIFIGAAEDNVHSHKEKVHKKDIISMLKMYEFLIKELNY